MPGRFFLLPAYCSCLVPFSPAHKVHNLYPIIFLQHSRGPVSATHHILIEFDCYSLGCEVELCDQFFKREIIDDFAVFPIYSQVQEIPVPQSAAVYHAAQLGLTAPSQGLDQNGRAARGEARNLRQYDSHAVVLCLH